MRHVEDSARREDIVKRARRRRTARRVKRFDILVALTLLLLLLLGWARDFIKTELWPGSHLLTANGFNQAGSGGALR
ncbi:MAG TPA: hypothetical protein VFZ16_07105 [Hyphomicrobiaceae bacterium]|nr:hypothetical protein [Hyphomicrobiaceae bacterium]